MQKNLFHKAKRKTNQYAREKQAKETLLCLSNLHDKYCYY